MKKKDMSYLMFSKDLVEVFWVYIRCLEEYFKDGENIVNHKKLYDYYKQLDSNVKNLVTRYGNNE